eukprot:1001599-Rhodomonas_salina.2
MYPRGCHDARPDQDEEMLEYLVVRTRGQYRASLSSAGRHPEPQTQNRQVLLLKPWPRGFDCGVQDESTKFRTKQATCRERLFTCMGLTLACCCFLASHVSSFIRSTSSLVPHTLRQYSMPHSKSGTPTPWLSTAMFWLSTAPWLSTARRIARLEPPYPVPGIRTGV